MSKTKARRNHKNLRPKGHGRRERDRFGATLLTAHRRVEKAQVRDALRNLARQIAASQAKEST